MASFNAEDASGGGEVLVIGDLRGSASVGAHSHAFKDHTSSDEALDVRNGIIISARLHGISASSLERLG